MTTSKFKRGLLGLALLLTVGAAPAATLKIATIAPDGTSWMTEMRAAGKRIEERTEGRVELKFYPGGVMGSASTVLRKMRVGQLHGGAFATSELAEVYPDWALYGMPFLFESMDEVIAVREEIDPLLAEGLEARGLTMVGLAGGGFGYLMSGSRIASRDALIASKVWVPEGDDVAALSLELAGVSPISLPISDVYTGLQTGLIDTVVNTPVGTIAFQWHTRVKYLVDLPVSYVAGGIAIDNRAFRRLSAADQAIMREELEGTLAELQAQDRLDNVGAKAALAGQGIETIPISDEDLAYWHALADRTLDQLNASNDYEFDHVDALREAITRVRAR
ncbi:MAG: TRAP transporter substrate-binding protein DctP [Pseudomonadota bacterium]